jgi:hypothetical protein
MYADKLEAESGSRKVVKDRINGGSGDISTRVRQVTGKRQRQDDKWEHDLFSSDKPQLSSMFFPLIYSFSRKLSMTKVFLFGC